MKYYIGPAKVDEIVQTLKACKDNKRAYVFLKSWHFVDKKAPQQYANDNTNL